MASGAEGFKGYDDFGHVHQPDGSELCMAAIAASATGVSVAEAHVDLYAADMSEKDGSTPPWLGKKTVEIGDVELTLTAFQSPVEGAEDTPGVIELMDEQFDDGHGVVLLYKKTDDPKDKRLHYVLLPGYRVEEGDRKGPVYLMDPLEYKNRYMNRNVLASMIDRSLNFQGVFAYSLTVGEIPDAEESDQA